MKKVDLRGCLMLVLTALIWGVAFVAQSVGMDYVGPFTFNAVRTLIGGVVLLPCIALLDRAAVRRGETPASWKNKKLLTGGVACGFVLAMARMLQQTGILYTTVGKAGFITALYIVLVPVFGLFLKKRPRPLVWIGVVLAVGGMYLLCITDGLSMGRGELLLLLCAAMFALHILVIEHFSPQVDGVRMSCIQFFTCSVLCGVPMLLFEQPHMAQIAAAWAPVLYAGVLSCGVAYTLQVVGQRRVPSSVAALILSLESVFSVLAGWVILRQRLSPRELFGCLLVFCAVVIAQLPERERLKVPPKAE